MTYFSAFLFPLCLSACSSCCNHFPNRLFWVQFFICQLVYQRIGRSPSWGRVNSSQVGNMLLGVIHSLPLAKPHWYTTQKEETYNHQPKNIIMALISNHKVSWRCWITFFLTKVRLVYKYLKSVTQHLTFHINIIISINMKDRSDSLAVKVFFITNVVNYCVHIKTNSTWLTEPPLCPYMYIYIL